MSESKDISIPVSQDEVEDESFLDDLSDNQLDDLPDERIQRLSEASRRKIVCYYLVRNLSLSLEDPRHKTLAWIAKRVGRTDRQLRRWRTDSSWSSLMKDVLDARSNSGGLPPQSEDENMKVLEELRDNEESTSSVKLSAIKEINRMKGNGNATAAREAEKREAEKREAEERREQMYVKIKKYIKSVSEGEPKAAGRRSQPTPLEPDGSRLSEEQTSDPS